VCVCVVVCFWRCLFCRVGGGPRISEKIGGVCVCVYVCVCTCKRCSLNSRIPSTSPLKICLARPTHPPPPSFENTHTQCKKTTPYGRRVGSLSLRGVQGCFQRFEALPSPEISKHAPTQFQNIRLAKIKFRAASDNQGRWWLHILRVVHIST